MKYVSHVEQILKESVENMSLVMSIKFERVHARSYPKHFFKIGGGEINKESFHQI